MQNIHNRQKKIAVLSDVTGFGKCSVAVSFPIISKLRIQCCPVPTAVLSNQTAFDSCYIDDYTKRYKPYTDEWEKLRLKFEGIQTGFMNSVPQIENATDFISRFGKSNTIVQTDPIMGDDGVSFSFASKEYIEKMRDFIRSSDIITPNLTEACMLTDTSWRDRWHLRDIHDIIMKLSEMGPDRIVITGIPSESYVTNAVYYGKDVTFVRQKKIGGRRDGTGDIFAAVIIADAVNGVDFLQSVKRASAFVKKCLMVSVKMGIPGTDGAAFEEVIDDLRYVHGQV